MPTDDDTPPRIAKRAEKADPADPPPPYLFRRPHPNEGKLLGYALPASAVVLIVAGIIGGSSPPGELLPKLMIWCCCIPIWAWGVSHYVRKGVFS